MNYSKENIYNILSFFHNYAQENKDPVSIELYVKLLNMLNISNIYRGILPYKMTSMMFKSIIEKDFNKFLELLGGVNENESNT